MSMGQLTDSRRNVAVLSMSKEPNFMRRMSVMGDWSEEVFKNWAEENEVIVEEWGLKRPAFKRFSRIPANVRHQPDYLCEDKKRHFFVEVKGVGNDQKIKIKLEDLSIIRATSEFHELPVMFFVYDMKKKRTALFNYYAVVENKDDLTIAEFPDGNKKYYQVPTSMEWIEWQSISQ